MIQQVINPRKKCLVVEIADNKTVGGGYAIFDDCWISSFDKILYDEQDNEYPVLGFYELERMVCKYPELNKFFHINGIHGYVRERYSCLLIEGAKVGDIFYTHNFK